MTYAVVHDIACSWGEYESAWRDVFDPLPAGLLVHVAGPTDEGVRLIHIWTTDAPEAGEQADRLTGLVANVRRRIASRDFRPAHLLISEQAAHPDKKGTEL